MMNTEQQRLINRTRYFLKGDLGRARLMNCAPSHCVREEITATQVLYHVTDKDFILTFEQRGLSRGNFTLRFIKMQPLVQITLDDIARNFILSILTNKGTQAVAQHRFGEKSAQILEAAKRLLQYDTDTRPRSSREQR